jgi:3-dehydroquinate synthase
MSAPTRIAVRGDQPYDVVVGHDLGAELVPMLGSSVHRVAVMHSAPLAARAGAVIAALEAAGLKVTVLHVPDAEQAKTAEVAAGCWAELGLAGFTRSDALVAVGGGAVTDLGGFVAATWLRGVPVVHVPTTLLGMVDAAVGGKTGINTAEGKNLVGSFHPPAGVLCDLDALATLPAADYVAGLAEVVKAGFISDLRILELVEADPAGAARFDGGHTRELIERAVQVKADVVSGDLREQHAAGSGVSREILNYGHTLGHAIERAEGYRWRHGEAVAVGMVYAAELARLAGRLDDDAVARHRAVIGAVGLPLSYGGGQWDDLLRTMQVDKKARADRLRFVVLDGVGRPGVLESPAPELLAAAFSAVSSAH